MRDNVPGFRHHANNGKWHPVNICPIIYLLLSLSSTVSSLIYSLCSHFLRNFGCREVLTFEHWQTASCQHLSKPVPSFTCRRRCCPQRARLHTSSFTHFLRIFGCREVLTFEQSTSVKACPIIYLSLLLLSTTSSLTFLIIYPFPSHFQM